jgi:hypothetical protein
MESNEIITEMNCFRAARSRADCSWETTFSLNVVATCKQPSADWGKSEVRLGKETKRMRARETLCAWVQRKREEEIGSSQPFIFGKIVVD